MLLVNGLRRKSMNLSACLKTGLSGNVMSVPISSECSPLWEVILTSSHKNEPNSEEVGAETTSEDARLLEKSKLSDQEKLIERVHQEACEAGERTYIDPLSGYKVFTELAHKKRGRCCGSACRNCPYGQINVEDSSKRKTFNSFYV